MILMKLSVSLITYLGIMEIFLVKYDGGYRLYGDRQYEDLSVATHRAVCKPLHIHILPLYLSFPVTVLILSILFPSLSYSEVQ